MASDLDETSGLSVTVCSGRDLAGLIPALAALRVRVFHDWPYLYAGDPDYEAAYLAPFTSSPRAAVIIAREGERIVGASTCLPLTDETANIQAPFIRQGLDPARFFYFGESVLLPEMRGRGVGVAFFQAREAHARAVSACDYACFCGVIRPADHPARPVDYVPLDAFWTKRGFVRRPDLVCEIAWADIGAPAESAKPLMFWIKSLNGAPLP